MKAVGKVYLRWFPAMGIGTLALAKESVGYVKKNTEQDIAEAFTASLEAGVNFF